MVSMLALSVVDCVIKPRFGQIKDYNIASPLSMMHHIGVKQDGSE
jgi:hypothetical protein